MMYLLCIFTALILNLIISVIMGIKQHKMQPKTIITCTIVETIGIIIGAKLLDIVIHYDVYLHMNAEEWYITLTSGYTFLGGIFGAIFFIFLYAIISKKDFEELCTILVPNLLLVYSISKLGCFFAGCCKGIEINGHALPIQIIETITYFLIYLYIKQRKHTHTKQIYLTCILFGTTRFLIEFLRESTTHMPITISQILSIFIVILGLRTYYIEKNT